MKVIRLIVAFVCVLAWAVPARTERSLLIQDFAADVRVNADGGIDVTETIRVQFVGSWNGIYRTIPVVYRTPQGFDYELRLDVTSITDERGHTLKYESSRERHYRKLKIWVPGAVDTAHTVTILYHVRNGLKFFDEHDELYWNVTGDEWDVPIERARALVHLPPSALGLRTVAFTGGYGSQESAVRVTTIGTDVAVETTRILNFREGLTVAVAWNVGAVARPTAAQKTVDFLGANLPFGLPIGVFGLMCWLWARHGRDPRRRPIAAQYEPPAAMTPAELGTLVDNKPDMRDITASIVDLAVRGYIRIREEREDRFLGLGTKTDYVLALLRPSTEWQGLRPHEVALLSALFSTTDAATPAAGAPVVVSLNQPEPQPSVDEVRVSDLKNRFYKSLPGIRDRIFDRLVGKGYYVRRPDTVQGTLIAIAMAVGIGGVVISVIFDFGLAAVLAFILSGLIVGGFGLVMPARTIAGTRALEGALGFEEFLDRVEGDRLERIVRTPDLFERFLPYAMALGVERNWARAFEGIYTSQPTWYVGSHAGVFSPRMFAGSLADLSHDAGSAMASAPRSSGGSGFSGGGSGRGFGGGGGGGF